ncbi:MAG: hypothetical protein WA113_04015 [Desulfitobacteriaceae bacterium]
MTETVGTIVALQHSRGRELEEEHYAKINIFSFNRAAVDGYAIITNDTRKRQFAIMGEISADHDFFGSVASGEGT